MTSVKKHYPLLTLLRFLVVVIICVAVISGLIVYWAHQQIQSLGIESVQIELGNPMEGEPFFRSIEGVYVDYDQGAIAQSAQFALQNIDLKLSYSDKGKLGLKVRSTNADIHLHVPPSESESELVDYIIDPIQSYLIPLPVDSIKIDKFTFKLDDPSLNLPLEQIEGTATVEQNQLTSRGQMAFTSDQFLNYKLKTDNLAKANIALTNENTDTPFELDADVDIQDTTALQFTLSSHPEAIKEYALLFQFIDTSSTTQIHTLGGKISFKGHVEFPSLFKGSEEQWTNQLTLKGEAHSQLQVSLNETKDKQAVELKQVTLNVIQTLEMKNGVITSLFQPDTQLDLSASIDSELHDSIFMVDESNKEQEKSKVVQIKTSLAAPVNVQYDSQGTINIQYPQTIHCFSQSTSINRTLELSLLKGHWQFSHEMLGETEFQLQLNQFNQLPVDYFAGEIKVNQIDEQYMINSAWGLKNQPQLATINAVYNHAQQHLNLVSNLTIDHIGSKSPIKKIIGFYAPGLGVDKNSNLTLDAEFTLKQIDSDNPNIAWKVVGNAQFPSLTYEDYHQENMDLVLSGKGNLNQFDSNFTLLSDSIFVGVPINHFQMEAVLLGDLERHTLEAPIKNLQFSVFKGAVFLKEQATLYYDLPRPDTSPPSEIKTSILEMQANKLDLSAILDTMQNPDIKGSGQLSGTIPIQVDSSGNIQVADGNLTSIAPGGIIQYRDSRYTAMAQTNSNMKLLFDSLDNFHYNELQALIDYQHSGQTNIHLRLNGRNPDESKGLPIDLNVNLELNLLKHLESLRLASEEFSQDVGGKIQDKQRHKTH